MIKISENISMKKKEIFSPCCDKLSHLAWFAACERQRDADPTKVFMQHTHWRIMTCI